MGSPISQKTKKGFPDAVSEVLANINFMQSTTDKNRPTKTRRLRKAMADLKARVASMKERYR